MPDTVTKPCQITDKFYRGKNHSQLKTEARDQSREIESSQGEINHLSF